MDDFTFPKNINHSSKCIGNKSHTIFSKLNSKEDFALLGSVGLDQKYYIILIDCCLFSSGKFHVQTTSLIRNEPRGGNMTIYGLTGSSFIRPFGDCHPALLSWIHRGKHLILLTCHVVMQHVTAPYLCTCLVVTKNSLRNN